MGIKSYFLLLFSLLSIAGVCQEKSWNFGLQFDHASFPSKQLTGVGISFEKMIQEKIGIGYSCLIGQSAFNGTYIYSGIGQTAAFYALKNIPKARVDALALQLLFLGIVLPENYSYHFRINDKLRGAAFLSPYGFEYEKDYSNNKELYNISFEYGLRLHHLKGNRMLISPQLGLKSYYSKTFRELGITGGITISLINKYKDSEKEKIE